MGPRDPLNRKKSIFLGFLLIVDPKKSPKKISAIFRTGCQKVSTWSVNGANCLLLHYIRNSNNDQNVVPKLLPFPLLSTSLPSEVCTLYTRVLFPRYILPKLEVVKSTQSLTNNNLESSVQKYNQPITALH